MTLVPMKAILDAAEQGGYGVGAFNVNNMEQLQGVMQAARETDSPVIIQVSRGALKYSNLIYLQRLMEAAIIDNPNIPIATHLDHGNSPEACIKAIEHFGFTSVMMDGSLLEDGKTASDYDYNMRVTRDVVDYAHPLGITVEAEIGCLGGLEEGHGSEQEHVTNPKDARRLYDDCHHDACAVAWGTRHGAYKGEKGKPPKLRHDVLVGVHGLVPEIHIVSHGSSSLPRELIDGLNTYGVFRSYIGGGGHRHLSAYGQDFDLDTANPKNVLSFLYETIRMPESVGVPMTDLQQAIKEGVRKINVDTDGRVAITGKILEVLCEKPSEFDPRQYLGPAREATKGFVANAMIGFGSAGHARDVEKVTLEEMAKRYK